MVLDYLRYVAFEGRLKSLFREGLGNFVDPGDTTGQHLRFKPDVWRKVWNRFGNRFWEDYRLPWQIDELKELLGFSGGPDLVQPLPYSSGAPPSVAQYKERAAPELEVLVDIDPRRWSPRYDESPSYEGTKISYRRAGAASGQSSARGKVFGRENGPGSHGTVCGVFVGQNGDGFALTCGHVAGLGQEVMVDDPLRLWGTSIWPRHARLGKVVHREVCGPVRRAGTVEARVDAALISLDRPIDVSGGVRAALLKPVSAMLQEEPVQFRGSGRVNPSLARVAAVTVRKSIDIFKNGELREIGDVLMLGHRLAMYTARRVSTPGDSGAAVRYVGPMEKSPSDIGRWHGMIIGGDDTGAFATYAEHLWSWAAEATEHQVVDFVLDE
jgi:hypothetical protein